MVKYDYSDQLCVNNKASVRLSEGRVEVCSGNYRTGVCSDNWDNVDATVVCRQLNMGENGGMPSLFRYLELLAFKVHCIQLLTLRDQLFIGLV